MNINNKFKQFCQGNWGKPNSAEKMHPLHYDILEADKVKITHKKKHKQKKPYIPYGAECPFCHEQLEEDKTQREDKNNWWVLFRNKYKKECKCGAFLVQDCPSCHRETWLKDKIYKHQYMGCGFEGERKDVS